MTDGGRGGEGHFLTRTYLPYLPSWAFTQTQPDGGGGDAAETGVWGESGRA